MAKIDEIKEILNSLRVAMSIAFGIFVLVIGKIVSLYSDNNINEIFWISTVLALILLLAIYFIVIKIAKKTREIRDIK